MLPVQIFVGQARDQKQRALARLAEAVAYQLLGGPCLDGRYRHYRHE
jgi:hypothetical protein